MPGMACVRRPDSEFHSASDAGVLAVAAYGISRRPIYVSDRKSTPERACDSRYPSQVDVRHRHRRCGGRVGRAPDAGSRSDSGAIRDPCGKNQGRRSGEGEGASRGQGPRRCPGQSQCRCRAQIQGGCHLPAKRWGRDQTPDGSGGKSRPDTGPNQGRQHPPSNQARRPRALRASGGTILRQTSDLDGQACADTCAPENRADLESTFRGR